MNLGWIEPKYRTEEQHEAHFDAVKAMPSFAIIGDTMATPEIGTKVLLTDAWKHPAVVAKLGYEYTGVHQLTGSCVGAGGGNALFTLQAIEILRNGDSEEFIVPFWLLPYGRSRYYMGERSQGEGSLGSTFAKACKDDGVIDANLQGLPPFTRNDGFIWGEKTEYTWSDGGRIDSRWLQESRKHLVHTTSELHSFEDVRDAILNGYPVTRAGIKFVRDGSGASVKSGVSIGRHERIGGHQETWLGYYYHPTLGELVYEQNQHGLNQYPDDPAGGAKGGCWVPRSDVEAFVKESDTEVFAYSQFDGYPAQQLPYILG